jgi:hypothetical protein
LEELTIENEKLRRKVADLETRELINKASGFSRED